MPYHFLSWLPLIARHRSRSFVGPVPDVFGIAAGGAPCVPRGSASLPPPRYPGSPGVAAFAPCSPGLAPVRRNRGLHRSSWRSTLEESLQWERERADRLEGEL